MKMKQLAMLAAGYAVWVSLDNWIKLNKVIESQQQIIKAVKAHQGVLDANMVHGLPNVDDISAVYKAVKKAGKHLK